MTSEEYVLNHDFGYGLEEETSKIKKIELRNIDDLKVYIFDSINNAYMCNIDNNNVEVENFGNVKIEIEKV